MNNTYDVLYKNGRTQTVTGIVVLFSSMNTDLSRVKNAVYLNADEVISIVEKQESPKEPREEV